MKRFHFLILIILLSNFTFAQMGITAVFDGPLSGGVPKGVELYVYESIADLSIYGLGSANNGGGSDGQEFTFPEVAISSGTYLYVASESTGFESFFGFPPNYISGAMLINGDDAIELFKDGAVVDVFGDINVDGTGESWEYLDGWAASDDARIISSTFTDTDWTYSGPNALDGETTNGTASTPVPIATYTALPVELSSFSVSIINGGVRLNWCTETEVNNYGFNILRQAQDDEWVTLGFVEGYGNSSSPKAYSFIDDEITSGKYAYKLKQIDNNGTFEYSKIIEIDVEAPLEFELSQNYPNPFNPSTTIKFSLPASSTVKLSIFNILGEEVHNLVNETKEAGIYTINFDASLLNSGIYIYKLETNNIIQVKKMTLIK